ncbi:segregation/condensation protein A [Candidatus Pacearchaeota archaeon]|nr:segregation/condensation protein A [Candidatus Pacearchaeota archaeon]
MGDIEVKSAKQNQIQDILYNREIGWQEIIYDLINTEELDPWDINIIILTEGYLTKIQSLEESDFFVSSKVLLAASLLLRIKSEVLLSKHLRSIDEILFGSEEKKPIVLERIELDEEIPELVPKSPIPRYKKVTLQELIDSLNKAISTENRRIKKEIINKNALRESSISLPNKKTINIKSRIRQIYLDLSEHFNQNKNSKKISFEEFVGNDRDKKIITFSPLLHLENQQKIWLDQKVHFEEIHIWLKKTYLKHNPDPFADLEQEVQKELENLDGGKKQRLQEINKDFENPLADLID